MRSVSVVEAVEAGDDVMRSETNEPARWRGALGNFGT